MMRNDTFRKTLVLGIIVLLICMSITTSIGTRVVKKSTPPLSNGKTLYVGGSGPGNYSKIQNAIDNASDGDTVFVYNNSSPYYEKVHLNKRINLIGEDRDSTVINRKDNSCTVVITADNTLISGFTITGNYPRPFRDTKGIAIGGSNNIIQGNKIAFNEHGIKTHHDAKKNMITNNLIIHNCEIGIFDQSKESTNTVKYNVIGGNSRDALIYEWGGIYKHHSGGYYHHNDFEFNHGCNAFTEASYWGVWDDGSEGNYWDDWPGYPDKYKIPGKTKDQYDYHPKATRYFNYTIVLIEETYYEGNPGKRIYFKSEVNKPDSSVSWLWEFGDGNTSNQKNPSHSYSESGIYNINVTVTDTKGQWDMDKCIAYIGIPPDKPTIKGPTKGKPNQWLVYSIVATDSDSEYLNYYIDWADGYTDNIGPYLSGEVAKIGYSWYYAYNYTIMVKAIDETHRESEWAYLTVSIPRNKILDNSFFLMLLERFPLLREVLSRIINL